MSTSEIEYRLEAQERADANRQCWDDIDVALKDDCDENMAAMRCSVDAYKQRYGT